MRSGRRGASGEGRVGTVTDAIMVLAGALGLLGLAIYGSVQVLKVATPSSWRKGTRLGRATMKAAPLALGAVLCAVPHVLDSLTLVFGRELALAWQARAVLGLVAGATATQAHALMRRRLSDALTSTESARTGPNHAP